MPGEANDEIKQIGTPAQLRFRKVLNATPDTATQPAKSTPVDEATTPKPTLASVEKKLGGALSAAQALKSPPDPTNAASATALKPSAPPRGIGRDAAGVGAVNVHT